VLVRACWCVCVCRYRCRCACVCVGIGVHVYGVCMGICHTCTCLCAPPGAACTQATNVSTNLLNHPLPAANRYETTLLQVQARLRYAKNSPTSSIKSPISTQKRPTKSRQKWPTSAFAAVRNMKGALQGPLKSPIVSPKEAY
jgi:hypothetical protein